MEKEKRDELIAYAIAYGWVGCILFMIGIQVLQFFHLSIGWPSLNFIMKGFVLACILNIPSIVLGIFILIVAIIYYCYRLYEVIDYAFWRLECALKLCSAC